MFNVGGGEIIVIAFIALLVLGPQRLPEAARQAGRAMAELRRFSSGFQGELRAALDEQPGEPSEPPRRAAQAVAEIAASSDAVMPDDVMPGDAVPDDAVPDDVATDHGPRAEGPSRPRRRRPLTARDGTA